MTTSIVEIWNSRFGDSLPIHDLLLEATHFSVPETSRFVVKSGSAVALCRRDEKHLRIDLATAPSTSELCSSMTGLTEELRAVASAQGCEDVLWGGGDRHLFPGIPINDDTPVWLEVFETTSPVVMDFQGQLQALKAKAAAITAHGVLKSPENPAEESALLSFVGQEFPGRWTRDLEDDMRKKLINQHFGYFMGGGLAEGLAGSLAGYVRLYGWARNYWGPGVYFALPANNVGGLGPIGVAKRHRGRGLGSSILKLSWDVLLSHGLSTVRIDWTTERNFYEKWGLHLVQSYQPAHLGPRK